MTILKPVTLSWEALQALCAASYQVARITAEKGYDALSPDELSGRWAQLQAVQNPGPTLPIFIAHVFGGLALLTPSGLLIGLMYAERSAGLAGLEWVIRINPPFEKPPVVEQQALEAAIALQLEAA